MGILLESGIELIELIKRPIFIIVLAYAGILFYIKNSDDLELNKKIVRNKKNSALELTITQISIGLIAGFAISLMLKLIGIKFSQNSGVEIMFVLSLIFMKIKPRMICFSYSATVVIFVSIAFEVIYNITGIKNYFNFRFSDIIILVGLMHLVEGMLVFFDGDRAAVPIFKSINGKIYGGFKLNRNWLTPISSFVGIIGYSATTYTLSKKRKARESGIIISTYGLLLIFLTYISRGNIAIILVAIIMPIAHELMLKAQSYFEKKRKEKFVSEDGLCVLDVDKEGKANSIGLESGDIILRVNDFNVSNHLELFNIIKKYYGIVEVEFKKSNGKIYKNTLKLNNAEKLLVVFVPREEEFEEFLNAKDRSFKKILESTCNKNN